MIEGSCLCGEIVYRAERTAGPMGNCHCRMCRKAHGSAFSTVLPVEADGFRWVRGEAGLQRYESSSGKWRWFCGRCGSQLVSTRDAIPDSLLLRAGSIDSGYDRGPVAHGWVESRATWHEIADELPRFERGFPNAPPGVD